MAVEPVVLGVKAGLREPLEQPQPQAAVVLRGAAAVVAVVPRAVETPRRALPDPALARAERGAAAREAQVVPVAAAAVELDAMVVPARPPAIVASYAASPPAGATPPAVWPAVSLDEFNPARPVAAPFTFANIGRLAANLLRGA